MKKYDLTANEQNVIESIQNNVTGRNEYVFNLVRMLNLQDDSLSIAIDSKWGNGKTFFVKQCKFILDHAFYEENENNDITKARNDICNGQEEDITKQYFRTIYYDAWSNDNNENPIDSLLKSLAYTDWATETKEALSKAISIGSSIVSAITPVNTDTLLKDLKNGNVKSLDKLTNDFSKALSALAPKNGKLVIFIDELDRCKPTFTVKLLEQIKHYFNNPYVTFIFSVDREQLQNTIRHYYGNQFDGLQYLDRFFDLVIPLPKPNIENYLENTKGILEIDEVFGMKENYFKDITHYLISRYNLSIRQINHFYLRANSATYIPLNHILNSNSITSKNEKHGSFFVYCFLLPFLIILSETNQEKYEEFINGDVPQETLEVLANCKELQKFVMAESEEQALEKITSVYNAIFNNSETEYVEISRNCTLESPERYKKELVNACSILSSSAKWN